MAFVTLGCRPARDHPDIPRISGSGRVRLVSERGLFRAYLGFFSILLKCWFWHHLDVTTSGFVWQSMQLWKSLSDWIVTFWLKFKSSCRDCASSVTCLICWTTLSIRLILYDVHPLGMMVRVSITWKRRVLEISIWGILVMTSCRFEMTMPLCNMRSLGIAGGVGSTLKSWETPQ